MNHEAQTELNSVSSSSQTEDERLTSGAKPPTSSGANDISGLLERDPELFQDDPSSLDVDQPLQFPSPNYNRKRHSSQSLSSSTERYFIRWGNIFRSEIRY